MTIGRTMWLAAGITLASVIAPAMPIDAPASAPGCRTTTPTFAVSTQRPPALRYKAAPLNLCVPGGMYQVRPSTAA